MGNWYIAPAVQTLINQVNKAAPNRSKSMDGTIGDLDHSKSKSEHNPNSVGAVRAWDCTHDPNGGVDCFKLSENVIDEMDRRGIEGYVIFNGRIRSTTVGRGRWRPYPGSNKHNHHMHVSVISGWGSLTGWSLPSLGSARTTTINPGRVGIDGNLGDLSKKRFAYILGLESFTEIEWWKAAQKWAGLTGKAVDGIPGPRTWETIRLKLGSGSGKVDGIVKAWQAWMNEQAAPPPIIVGGASVQGGRGAPPWPLRKDHLIFHDPKGRTSWHDGAGNDVEGRAAIMAFRHQLRARGWNVPIVGTFDKALESVVKKFQAEKNLRADGIIGPETWKMAWEAPVT